MGDFALTHGQQKAYDELKAFLLNKDIKVFVLKGYAGTGKTTLMRLFISEMQSQKKNFTLLASTGRAAKILANATGCETRTIHGEIYKFSDLNQNIESVVQEREKTNVDNSGPLLLNFELTPIDTGDSERIYIVDEASMISDAIDKNSTQALFGSGKLLEDLFKYDNSGKFIFVGDICQLPPITQSVSPALSVSYIKDNYNYSCCEAELTEVVRQSADVDIVRSAHKIRNLYYNPQPWKWAKFPFRGYKDIHIVNSQLSLISEYIKHVNEYGFNDTTMLCYSNRQCDSATQLLRPSFGHVSNQLEKGDLLLVTQNNLISGLMNGDLVVVDEVIVQEKRAGLTFLKVTVRELFTKRSFSQLLIAEILYSNQTNLTQSQQKELFIDFYYRMREKNVKQKTQQFNKHMLEDPYLNALRAVFGYALTCHKAQGGEWNYVFLDIPSTVSALPKPYVYQWIYTAMTRAKKGLFVVDNFWVV